MGNVSELGTEIDRCNMQTPNKRDVHPLAPLLLALEMFKKYIMFIYFVYLLYYFLKKKERTNMVHSGAKKSP